MSKRSSRKKKDLVEKNVSDFCNNIYDKISPDIVKNVSYIIVPIRRFDYFNYFLAIQYAEGGTMYHQLTPDNVKKVTTRLINFLSVRQNAYHNKQSPFRVSIYHSADYRHHISIVNMKPKQPLDLWGMFISAFSLIKYITNGASPQDAPVYIKDNTEINGISKRFLLIRDRRSTAYISDYQQYGFTPVNYFVEELTRLKPYIINATDHELRQLTKEEDTEILLVNLNYPAVLNNLLKL